jgi:hypothetical protein
MPDLYIIGAGCSRNYSQSKCNIKGLKSPLNKDFFKMARRVIENTGMKHDLYFMDEVNNLISTIAPLYGQVKGGLDFFENKGLTLEDVMTLIDINDKLFIPFASPQNKLTESRELHTLKELLVRTLDYALMGSPCTKHNKLAKKLSSGDIVLSFNYDILLDIALFNLGKITENSYRMNFSKIHIDEQWLTPKETQSDVTLLKLHGSLNWIRCGFCGALLLNQYRQHTLIGAEEFRCPRCSSDERYAKRVIVPPAQSKDYGDRDIAFLWIQADNLLKEISRIICIGYSFPSSDFDMISLMRRLRAKQSKMPDVYFISPDSQARKRAEVLFGKQVTQYDNLSKYLDT